MAEGVGFEPTVPAKGTTVFETAPFDHSGTPPHGCAAKGNVPAPTASGNAVMNAESVLDRAGEGAEEVLSAPAQGSPCV